MTLGKINKHHGYANGPLFIDLIRMKQYTIGVKRLHAPGMKIIIQIFTTLNTFVNFYFYEDSLGRYLLNIHGVP